MGSVVKVVLAIHQKNSRSLALMLNPAISLTPRFSEVITSAPDQVTLSWVALSRQESFSTPRTCRLPP